MASYKACMEKVTSEPNVSKQIEIAIKQFEADNEILLSSSESIEQECKHLKIQIAEMSCELERINDESTELQQKQDDYFILSNKLVSIEYQLSQLDAKTKELRRNKPVNEIELLYRDPNNLNKVLESELNVLRENTTRLTKSINFYKTKAKEAENVIKNMEQEINNSSQPKTITIIPKSANETVILDKSERVTQTSNINFNPKKTKLKELINTYNKEIVDLNNEVNEFQSLNEKLERDNEQKRQELSRKFDTICKLEIELEMLKEKYQKIKSVDPK